MSLVSNIFDFLLVFQDSTWVAIFFHSLAYQYIYQFRINIKGLRSWGEGILSSLAKIFLNGPLDQSFYKLWLDRALLIDVRLLCTIVNTNFLQLSFSLTVTVTVTVTLKIKLHHHHHATPKLKTVIYFVL